MENHHHHHETHEANDMSIHETNKMMHDNSMMKMYFHFGLGDTLLFKNFVIQSDAQLFVACVIFLMISIFYEGLKYYRQYVLQKNYKFYQLTTISDQLDNTNGDIEARENMSNTSNRKQNFIRYLHLYQSFLHILQVAISYLLMLAFMTFNVCLCSAILLGAGVGYFLFFKQKLNCNIVTDHCN